MPASRRASVNRIELTATMPAHRITSIRKWEHESSVSITFDGVACQVFELMTPLLVLMTPLSARVT